MKKTLAILTVGSALLFSVSTAGQRTTSAPANPSSAQSLKPSSMKLEADFGRMPLVFVANQGQMDERVSFYVHGKDKSVFFTEGGVTFILNKQEPRQSEKTPGQAASQGGEPALRERHVVKLDFVGATPDVRPAGEQETDTVISYFKGNKEDWHTGLPTYGRVVYRNLWPGIDLAYSGTFGKLKYEFTVRPGADPSRIKLAYRGAGAVTLDADGRLEVRTPLGNMRDDVPVAFQMKDGKRVEIPMSFALDESAGSEMSNAPDQGFEPESRAFGFRVGEYDRNLPLVLDPVILVYCGYIGGSGDDTGQAIAIDPAGATYITGTTDSPDASFPDVVGPDLAPNGLDDAFVAKIRNDGSGLVYCGYIGGDKRDYGLAIAADPFGSAYVTGTTSSTAATFPKVGGPDLIHNGGEDAFVAKINVAGTALVYCGYIGGSDDDSGNGIVVDDDGHAFITGMTASSEATFPEVVGPDLTYNGGADAFVAEISANGNGLLYCGYIGGSSWDYGTGIAVDGLGYAYVTGNTLSTAASFPEKVGPDLSHNGNSDAFVAKVNISGNGLVYCGYIGGDSVEYARGIAVTGSNAYIAGTTMSDQTTFPVKVGPDVTKNGLEEDAFVAKVSADGTSLIYCGFIGGELIDYGWGIAVESSGAAYVVGETYSNETTFPEKIGPDLTFNGNNDLFVAKVNKLGTGFVYCGFIGGSGMEMGGGIAVDNSGNAYVVGTTRSTAATFPEAVGPDLIHNGEEDAFVAKVSYVLGPPGIGLSRQALSFGAVAGGVATGTQTVLVGNTGEDTLSWTAGSNKAWLTVDPTSGTNAAKLQVSVNPAGLAAGIQTGKITVSDPDASNSPQEITVTLRILAAGTSGGPFGDFATPVNGTLGITGAIPVTGWVLDDVETTAVKIWRDAVAGEAAGIKFIGDAVFVEGARPDVEALYPASPLNYRSGWGYMMLTNFLPGQGNGTIRIHAYITDKEGNTVLLGSKTITCDNAHASKPFGTIDTPPQGGDASGNPFVNFGWVLTPLPKTVQKNGIMIKVYVDGIELGNLAVPPNVYDQFRADVSGLFPGLNNSNGPVGGFYVDTMMFANGTHTIYWTAEDDAGAADGIGSRYFNIFNGGAAPPRQSRAALAEPADSYESAMSLPASYEIRKAKIGFATSAEPELFQPDSSGTVRIEMREVEPVELNLGVDPGLRGYLIAERELRPLPIGSTLDGEKGLFSWLPGPGFVGAYELVFLRTDESGLTTRIPVRIIIRPKFDKK